MKPPAIQGKWIGIGACIVLAAVALGAFSVVWRERQAGARPKAAVAVAAPPRQTAEISLPGRIQAHRVEQVPVPVDGKVETFLVEVGAEVYEGQLLAQIRSESLESEQAAAQLALDREQTKVNNLESDIVGARLEASRIRAEASRAQSEYDRAGKAFQRQRMLMAEGATPRLTFEKAEKEYNLSKSEFENLDQGAKQAEERADAIVKDLDVAKKLLQHATEESEKVKEHLAAGEVHAPVSGIVVGRRGEPGGPVDPSIRNLFEIAADLSQLEVVADAAPDVLARLKPGQPAMIRVAEVPGEALGGTVVRVEGGHVVVEFGNPNPLVKPGLTAQVVLKLT